MTIESPSAYAESALAFFNASGKLANSKIGTIGGTGPYSYGVVMTNSLQGAEAGIRREVTLEKSLITGGVLFDDARGIDGAATTTARSGIKAYGTITGSRIAGPVTYTYGQRGLDHRQRDHRPGDADRRRDRPRPGQPGRPRVQRDRLEPARRPDQHGHRRRARRRQLLGHRHHDRPGRDGHDAGDGARAADAFRPRRSTPRPTGAIVDPFGPTKVAWGETIYPVVVAADDFGVKSVALTANGLPVQTVGHTPYEFVYTPAYEHIGDHVVLAATITDSVRPDERRLHRARRARRSPPARPAPSAAPSPRRSRSHSAHPPRSARSRPASPRTTSPPRPPPCCRPRATPP